MTNAGAIKAKYSLAWAHTLVFFSLCLLWLTVKAHRMLMDKGCLSLSETQHQSTSACIPVYVLMATGQSREIRFSDQQWNLCTLQTELVQRLSQSFWILTVCKNCQMWEVHDTPTCMSSDKLTFKYFPLTAINYHNMRPAQPIWHPHQIK